MMIPMENIYWNDIGSFDAIAEVLSDKDKNVFKGDILAENCTDTMIIGDNRLIAGIDLENLNRKWLSNELNTEIKKTPDIIQWNSENYKNMYEYYCKTKGLKPRGLKSFCLI